MSKTEIIRDCIPEYENKKKFAFTNTQNPLNVTSKRMLPYDEEEI